MLDITMKNFFKQIFKKQLNKENKEDINQKEFSKNKKEKHEKKQSKIKIIQLNLDLGSNSESLKVNKRRPWYLNPVFIVLTIILILVIIFRLMNLNAPKEVDYSTLISRIKNQDFSRLEIDSQTVTLFPKTNNEKPIFTFVSTPDGFREDLRLMDITPETSNIYFKQNTNFDLLSLVSIVLFLIFIALFAYSLISTRSLASGGPIVGFGETRAKLFIGKKQDIKFDQVRGIDEAVEEVKEIVSFLKDREKYMKLGARIPKGVLLVGAPGTGKTLLARAIAGEAGVPFFFTSGSEFEEMLVGTGASRVRDLFAKAKQAAPSIIFIDEIDSIARKRGTVLHSANTEQTLNQILVEMDGFDKNTNVIVIAATNRPDVLDPAILRPGRFDRRIVLDLPDLKGREDILNVHAKGKPLASDVDLKVVAKRTIGFSGADLENMLNEAAIIAVKDGRDQITSNDIEEAATKVILGPAKKKERTDKMKKLVAYHEAGHAIAGYFTPEADKVHRISIISRGYTGGVTMYLPKEDVEELKTKAKFEAELIVLFGGRVAEKLVLNDISTGASSDIQKATKIAREMVMKYGMSSLGYIDFNLEDDSKLIKPFSEDTAKKIDDEVKRILDNACEKCENIIKENIDKLHLIAEKLLEKEVIEGDEFYELMNSNNTDNV